MTIFRLRCAGNPTCVLPVEMHVTRYMYLYVSLADLFIVRTRTSVVPPRLIHVDARVSAAAAVANVTSRDALESTKTTRG